MLAQLLILHVFSKHGVLSHVTSDRGSEFVSSFFRTLGKALDMKLHFTSGYHPEGNGQTKHMKLWSNISKCTAIINRIIGLIYSLSPNLLIIMLLTLLLESPHSSPIRDTTPVDQDLVSFTARSFITDLEELHSQLRKTISMAQTQYSTSTNR